MKSAFSKLSITILSLLGLIGITLLVIAIIENSNDILISIIAVVCIFLFGTYYYYLKNKPFANKDSKIFLLYKRKTVNIFLLAFALLLIGVFAYKCIQKGPNVGLILIVFGGVIFNFLTWILFPFRYGKGFIMTDKEGIYSSESGYVKWETIKTFNVEADIMHVSLELNDNEKKSIVYNKHVDIELLKSEITKKVK